MSTWGELVSSPATGVVLTLAAYQAGRWLHRRTGGRAWAQPVLVAVVLVGGLLLATGTSYADYLEGASLVSFLLGPATVALALPLHQQIGRVRRAALPVVGAVLAGASASVVSAVLLTRLLGGPAEMVTSMAAKATTTPVAIALSAEVGGVPALSAVFAISAGILGAVAGPAVLSLLRVRDERARGLALGAVSHGIGTSRALAESRTQGAFSGLSMGLTALATSVLLPLWALVLLR